MYGRNINFVNLNPQQIHEVFDPFNGIVDYNTVDKYARGIAFATEQGKLFFARNLNILYSKLMMLAANTEKPFLPIPKKSEGRIRIGKYVQGSLQFSDCMINPDDLIQSAIIAAPNKGKTRLIFTLIREIMKMSEQSDKKTSVVMVDKKQDGRNMGPDVIVLSIEDLGINLFDAPPSCDQRKWISDVCQLLMSIWQYFQRSRNTLMKTVYNLYESKQKVPTMLEIYEAFYEEELNNRRISSTKLEVNAVNQDRVENALKEFGKCFVTRKTFPLYEFLDAGIPLVIEADVSNDSFALLLGWLLLYIYRYRKSNNIRGNLSEGGTVVVCDEAYLIWESSRDYSESRRELGANFISTAPMFIRDFRTAIVAASQRPISPDYMATTNLKIVGYCGDYDDARYLAGSLGDPSLVDVIAKLGVGQFIIKIGDQKPALLQTENFPLEKVDDAELKERMKPFIDYIREYCKEEETEDQSNDTRQTVRLSKDAKRLLVDVLAHPESTVSTRYFRLELKGKKAQDIVEEILSSKYANLVVEPIESTKAAKYLVLTQQAIEWLKSEKLDVRLVQHIGNVSPLHALYQNILQIYLMRSGWNVRHDHPLGNKFLDVYAEKEDSKVGFEIAINSAVDVSRTASALASVTEYLFLCRDMATVNSIRSQLTTIQNEKIRYLIASQYIMRLKKGILDYYTYNTENTQNTKDSQNLPSSTCEQAENRSTQQVG